MVIGIIETSISLSSGTCRRRIKRLISEVGFRHKSRKKFFLKYSRTVASDTKCSDEVLRYRCFCTVFAIDGVSAIIWVMTIAILAHKTNRLVASMVFRMRCCICGSSTPANSGSSVFFRMFMGSGTYMLGNNNTGGSQNQSGSLFPIESEVSELESELVSMI